MLNFMSKITLFYNFKYVKNHTFGRKKMPGSQKDLSLFPAMQLGAPSQEEAVPQECGQGDLQEYGLEIVSALALISAVAWINSYSYR